MVRLKPDATHIVRLKPDVDVTAGRGVRIMGEKMERETGFEPATSTLARSHSTTELFPPVTNP